MRGVVDSEDIPLNLSRELLQDNALIIRLNKVLTGRILKMLHEQSRRDPEKYMKFFNEYGNFLREGIWLSNDFSVREDVCGPGKRGSLKWKPVGSSLILHTALVRPQDEIFRLMRYESSTAETGKLTSIDDYVERMPESQKDIYYLCAPSRAVAENSPYLDAVKSKGYEVRQPILFQAFYARINLQPKIQQLIATLPGPLYVRRTG
eukprot:m.235605 g.235605  ORF g.235605 m.235605 type:complete len:206 (-) comp10891_c0_seq12:63-680(-)